MDKKEKTLKIVGRIPKGKVVTYGMVSKLAGVGSARPIGNWLHNHNRPISEVPCHRVVNSKGCLADHFGAKGGIETQVKRLKSEGVKVKNHKVDLKKYLWKY